MKKLLIGLLALGSVSAFASEVQTKCGKPELLIKGVKSVRQAFADRIVTNTLEYQILVNGQEVSAAGHELDLIVARAAIEAGAELCETIDKSEANKLKVTRSLHIKY
jgi:hypothetical protein